MTSSSHQMATSEMLWGRPTSLLGWKAYLGEDHQGAVSPYAAPAHAEDLSGLPPAYMMIGELDLMRDENIVCAMRLMQAGVPTELHVYPGAFHGFEGLGPECRSEYPYSEGVYRGAQTRTQSLIHSVKLNAVKHLEVQRDRPLAAA